MVAVGDTNEVNQGKGEALLLGVLLGFLLLMMLLLVLL